MKKQLDRIEAKLDVVLSKPIVEGSIVICDKSDRCVYKQRIEYRKSPAVDKIMILCQSAVPCCPERKIKIYAEPF